MPRTLKPKRSSLIVFGRTHFSVQKLQVKAPITSELCCKKSEYNLQSPHWLYKDTIYLLMSTCFMSRSMVRIFLHAHLRGNKASPHRTQMPQISLEGQFSKTSNETSLLKPPTPNMRLSSPTPYNLTRWTSSTNLTNLNLQILKVPHEARAPMSSTFTLHPKIYH